MVDLAVLGQQLDMTILKVFSNPNNSMVLRHREQQRSFVGDLVMHVVP